MLSISPKQHPSLYDQGFFDRCTELWLGLASGHMGADLYQHHEGKRNGQAMSGVTTWNDHATSGTFPRMNRKAFLSRVGDIAKIIDEGTPIVEYGPTATTIELIEAVRSKSYVPVDSSVGIIEYDKKLLGRAVDCEVRPAIQDFFADTNLPVIDQPALGILLGPTISNLPGPVPHAEPAHELTRALRNLQRPTPLGGYFLVSMDANQDAEEIKKLYNEEQHRLFGVNFLYRLAAEIPTQGFNPDGFQYHPVWHSHCGLLAHTVRATQSQSFTMGSGRSQIDVAIREGDIFHYNNSFKYRPELFEMSASQAGLKIAEKWEDSSSIKLYLFHMPPALAAHPLSYSFRQAVKSPNLQ